MKIQKCKLSIFELAIISLIFLFALNFKGKVNYLFVFTVTLTLAWMYRYNIKIKFEKEFIVLSICFVFYFFIYSSYFPVGLESISLFLVGPSAAYFIGYHLISIYNKKNINLLLVMGWGLFIHGMLNMMKYFERGMKGRIVPDIWTGASISATLQGTFFTIICSLLFYNLFINKRRLYKYISIIAIIFCIYSTIQTASRTILIIIGIIFILNLILYMYLNKNKIISVLKMILCTLLIGLAVFLSITYNVFGIVDIYEKSPLYERVNSKQQTELDEDPRLEMYQKVLNGMLEYPMGGDKIEGVTYAHNLWLDVSKKVGIIPFSLLLLYTIMTLITIIKTIRCKLIIDSDKYIMFSIYMGLTLNFMVEPILEGVPYLFIIMCIINGATRKELNEARRSKYYESAMVKQHNLT